MTAGRLSRSLTVALLALSAVFVAGCYYESEKEIIRVGDAAGLEFLSGGYKYDAGGGRLTITAVPGINDYRYEHVPTSGAASRGYVRLMSLGDDIYVAQIKPDDDDEYYFRFYRITSDRRFVPMEPRGAIDELAAGHDVKLVQEDWILSTALLEGSRENVLAFLRAHADLHFEVAEPDSE